jgi:hypothetical protein
VVHQLDSDDERVRVRSELDSTHGGSYPSDKIDPAVIYDQLVATVDVGFKSVRRLDGVTPGITGVIEMPNRQFVLTMKGLHSLENSFSADANELQEKSPPLEDLRRQFDWGDEEPLIEAWAIASEMFAPT